MEHASFLKQIVCESRKIIVNHLTYDGQVGTLCLQNHQSTVAPSSCSSAHLREHHEGMLVSTEVGIVEHCVGIEDAHDSHIAEVKSLRYHLRTDKNVGPTGREVADDAAICSGGTSSVEVHSGYSCSGEEFSYAVFYLLRAISAPRELGALAVGALLWHGVSETAVVAGQQILRAMVSQ